MSETMLAVTGMTCMDCAHHVEQALRRVSGVRKVRVEYPKCVARIESEFPLAIDTLNAALPKSYRISLCLQTMRTTGQRLRARRSASHREHSANLAEPVSARRRR